MEVESVDPLIGRTIGPYQVIEQLGVGGMARVFKAYQPAVDRYVALKIPVAHLARDPDFRARFHREAKVFARLEHPHILPIYAVGEDDDVPYLVMRYVDAGTLKDLLSAGPLPIGRSVQLVGQVADALGYAHQRGVVHRDVKPANVLIDQSGSTLLTDFGIAKLVEETMQLTHSGTALGTPHYMAPEQVQAAGVDGRADLYALGVILYEALTGRRPYEADTPVAIAFKHVNDPLPLPRALNPAIPEVLERIILRAMAKDPADRFQTAEDFGEALRSALNQPTVDAARPPATLAAMPQLAPGPSSTRAAGGRVSPRHRTFFAIGGFAAVFVAIGLFALGSLSPLGSSPAAPGDTKGTTIVLAATAPPVSSTTNVAGPTPGSPLPSPGLDLALATSLAPTDTVQPQATQTQSALMAVDQPQTTPSALAGTAVALAQATPTGVPSTSVAPADANATATAPAGPAQAGVTLTAIAQAVATRTSVARAQANQTSTAQTVVAQSLARQTSVALTAVAQANQTATALAAVAQVQETQTATALTAVAQTHATQTAIALTSVAQTHTTQTAIAIQTALPYGPFTCIQGYVWRGAFTGDYVCVLPAVRTQAYQDNQLASSRVSPTGGPYGPNTCLTGFVWRQAGPSDLVCVVPSTRDQAAQDNQAASSRWVKTYLTQQAGA